MLSSTGGGGREHDKSKFINRIPSSSCSKSPSSASSSSSPSSPSVPYSSLFLHRHKTMEETWKNITLSSLHDHHARDQNISAANRRSMTLQYFLARPLGKDSSAEDAGIHGYGSSAPSPATPLSLNYNREFRFMDGHESVRASLHSQSNPFSKAPSFISPVDAVASSDLLRFVRRKFQEPENDSGDRRHKRMIKNRESAARSRARKQEYFLSAYTNELELELAHLIEENARLKDQEQLYQDAAAQAPKKRNLQRASTAPF